MAKRYIFVLSTILTVAVTQKTEGDIVSNTVLDPKRRTDLVGEGVLEQKDVLLDMLESKLREMKDKKKEKKKPERQSDKDNGDVNNCNSPFDGRCALPKNVDIRLKSNGISAVGDVDVQMKYGNSGNSTLNLDASGISNVGRAHLDLTVGNGGVLIPGLDNLLVGKQLCLKNCNNELIPQMETQGNVTGIDVVDTRRSYNNPTIENDTTTIPIYKPSNELQTTNTAQNNDTVNGTQATNEITDNMKSTDIEVNVTAVPTTDNDVIEIKTHGSHPVTLPNSTVTSTTGDLNVV